MRKSPCISAFSLRTRFFALTFLTSAALLAAEENPDLPIVDISDQKDRHTIIAAGTEQVYQGASDDDEMGVARRKRAGRINQDPIFR